MISAEAARFLCFLTVLAAVGLAERAAPRRRAVAPTLARWLNNFSLMAVSTLAVRLALPAGVVGGAMFVEYRGWGLLHRVSWPPALEFAAGMVWLDVVIYWQHRFFHRVPWLWRLHAVHHTDLDLDASSGIRFHPLEILISAGVKLAAIAALGVAPLTVTVFEVLLNASSIFNHGNMALPGDAWLRKVLVTPDMHRVHHTPLLDEHDSNFSFTVPWWDWLFKTYRAQPRGEHATLELGLSGDRDPSRLGLGALLVRPFKREDPLRPAHQRRLA